MVISYQYAEIFLKADRVPYAVNHVPYKIIQVDTLLCFQHYHFYSELVLPMN